MTPGPIAHGCSKELEGKCSKLEHVMSVNELERAHAERSVRERPAALEAADAASLADMAVMMRESASSSECNTSISYQVTNES
jgi:hypothetical protein